MAERKTAFGLEEVGYATEDRKFVFAFRDTKGQSHRYSCDYDTFVHIVAEFRDTLFAAARELDKLPGAWRNRTAKILTIDPLSIEVALAPDNKLALIVDSPNMQTFEVRLDPEAAPVIIKGLRQIQAELRRRSQ